MNGQPLENNLINLRDYEIVPEPIPLDETPRQFLLRMTGRDFPAFTFLGRDFTWQEVKDVGALPIIERIIEIAYRPRIILRRR